TIDPAKPQSTEEQIRVTLQNIMSNDSRDLIFDYWPISDAAPQNRASEVLVVATQGSVVNRYLKGFTALGLNCTHLDVGPCALASLVVSLQKNDAMVGTVALAEGLGYFAVVEKQRVLFWRPFELGTGKPAQTNLNRVGDEISKCVSHMV